MLGHTIIGQKIGTVAHTYIAEEMMTIAIEVNAARVAETTVARSIPRRIARVVIVSVKVTAIQ